MRGAKTVVTAVLLGLLAAAPAAADVRTTVTVEALLSRAVRSGRHGCCWEAAATPGSTLAATGNRNVRGQLSLRAELRREAGR